MDPLFEQLPEDLSQLTDEQLGEFIDKSVEVTNLIASKDEDTIGERTFEEVNEALAQAALDVDRARAEVLAREEQAAEMQAKIDEAVAKITGAEDPKPDQGDPAEDEEPTEVPQEQPQEVPQRVEETRETRVEEPVAEEEVFEEPLPVAASSVPRRPYAAPRRSPHRDPVPEQPERGVITAAAGGERLNSKHEVSERLTETWNRTRGGAGYQEIPVATFHSDLPESRRLGGLTDADAFRNMEKIEQVTSPQAITAAGGLCAPVTPYYGLADYGTAARPVRDALATFNADRGGIRFAAPPKLTDVSTAVGIRTAAQDAAGTPVKTCQTIPCPAFSEVDVSAIFSCITVGNMGARTFPEQVDQFQSLVSQAWARTAEINLLDRMIAQATAATPAPTAANSITEVLGVNEIAAILAQAAAAQRSRHRMSPDQPLRLIAPSWLEAAMAADNVRGNRFNEQTLAQELAALNINVTYTLDGATSASQIFGAQGATAALVAWPTYADTLLFPEGSYLYLDGGTLDIGLVRDSTLNAANNFQIFMESFEEVAFIGVESLRLRIPVCPTGANAAAVTVACPVNPAHA